MYLLGDCARARKDTEHDIKMYIIARGVCEVRQKGSDQIAVQYSDKKEEEENLELGVFVRNLIDSDHFGEISLIYDCKRSCTVRSMNYCTLATISRPDFQDVDKGGSLGKPTNALKQYICYYQDTVKLFLESSLNKVDFFKGLPPIVKNDLIYAMEREEFSKGDLITKRDEKVEKLVVIQDGIVEISVKLGNTESEDATLFTIERLSRGAVINY